MQVLDLLGTNYLIKKLIDFIMDKTFKVGFIYTSYDRNFDPNVELIGTWERIRGRFLWAADTEEIGSKGGEKTVALTTAQLPTHSHPVPNHTHKLTTQRSVQDNNKFGLQVNGGFMGYVLIDGSGATANATFTSTGWSGNTNNTGSGQAHDNMPPYISVYMWRRIA